MVAIGKDWRGFGKWHARLYRLLGGRLVDSVGGGRKVLLLTSVGRKSGQERTTPLVFMPDGPRWIVYASNGGKQHPPAWWLNLRANPRAQIQVRGKHIDVVAREADETEYAALWPRARAYNDHWASYQQHVKRLIPLVILTKAGAGDERFSDYRLNEIQ